ncbi:MAG: hypothetical protein EZS26_003440 [Candidatus Ordinivivax streblomastigis]|uniref:4-carboxymuconolactone decarboxylase n=1 Tax=Candidatus Ordinivivax streblomastigis TaxID=2540710 RepID=A0A5M8NVL9_9BACT|nr:MAG: hypothetical protein EZS26_003440 [Candidatus Ordinivivax streblomastigis]
MDRIELSRNKYQELFGSLPVPDKESDPELMEILRRFIFGEVFYTGNLDDRTREMVTIIALTANQTLPQLKAHTNAALNIGVTPVEIREAIYQCAPFTGFPKVLNAMNVANEVFSERGFVLPLEKQGTVNENERFEKGKEIQYPIYGNVIAENLKDLPANLSQVIPDFLTELCFGDFYTREGLSIQTRELLILCLLTVEGEKQIIKAHATGNLKVGNNKETMLSAMIHLIPYAGFPKTLHTINVIKELDEANNKNESAIFPTGVRASADYFTGTAYVNILIPQDETNGYAVGNVIFEPGCRNNWHTHPAGQILLVTAGRGYYQERSKPARPLYKGDVVIIPSGVEHWHGAAHDSSFVHIAITNIQEGSNVTWLTPVTDEEYNSLK